MSFEGQTRDYTLKQLYEKCRFTFQESELSPNIRKKIGLYSESLQDIWRYKNEVSRLKRFMENKRNTVLMLGLIGIFTLFFIIGVFFILIAVLYHVYSYSPSKRKYANMQQALDDRTRIWYHNIELLSKEITDELTAVHQQKIKPTVTEIKIDYASILKLAQERDQLKYLKCPNCGAPITPSPTGTTIVCKYCNKTIQTQSIIDELKEILYPNK